MAQNDSLTSAQMRECLATGASISEILELQAQGFEFDEILDFCNTAKAAKSAEKDTDAERQAKATRKAMRPENEHHPGVSVYSRPGGEQVNPKGDLVCKTFWAGTTLSPDTLTADELDLVNSVPEGKYLCTRSDSSKVKVTVFVTTGEQGQPEKKDIFFPTRGGLRHNLPSMVSMLREMHAQAGVASPA